MAFSRLLVIFAILSTSATAQKIISCSLKGLKEQKSYDIKFTYDSMVVGVNMPEKQYLAQKKSDWEIKEPGKGSDFVEQWFYDRKDRYEPTFIRNFEKYSDIKLADKNAKYTLVLKTTRTEGGWNIGIASHPGEIEGELWIVDSADQSNIIAKIGFSRFSGKNSNGGDFEMTARINSAYAIAGRWLGTFVVKKAR